MQGRESESDEEAVLPQRLKARLVQGRAPTFVSEYSPYPSAPNSPNREGAGAPDSRPMSASGVSQNSSLHVSGIPASSAGGWRSQGVSHQQQYRATASSGPDSEREQLIAALNSLTNENQVLRHEYQTLYDRLVETESVALKQDQSLTLLKQQLQQASSEGQRLLQEKEFCLTQLHAVMRENETLRESIQKSRMDCDDLQQQLTIALRAKADEERRAGDLEIRLADSVKQLALKQNDFERQSEQLDHVSALLAKYKETQKADIQAAHLDLQAVLADRDAEIAAGKGEIARVKCLAESLQAELKTKITDLEWLEQQRLQAEEGITNLRHQLYDTQREKDDVQREVASLKGALEKKEEQFAESAAEVQKLQTTLYAQYNLVDQVMPANIALEAQVKELESRLGSLRHSLDSEISLRKQLEQQLQQQQQQTQDLSSNLTIEAEQAFQIEKQRQRLECTAAQLQEKLDVVEEELAAAKVKITRLEERKEGQRRDLSRSLERSDVLEDEVQQLRKALEESNDRKFQLECEVKELQDELMEQGSSAAERAASQQEAAVQVQNQLTRQLQAAEHTLYATQATLGKTTDQLMELTKRHDTLQARNAALEEQVPELQASLEELTGINERLGEDLNEVVSKLREAVKCVDQLKRERDSLDTQTKKDTSELDRLRREIKDVRQRLSDAAKATSESREKAVALEERANSSKRQVAALQNELESTKLSERKAMENWTQLKEKARVDREEFAAKVKDLEEKLEKESQHAARLQGKAHAASAAASRMDELKRELSVAQAEVEKNKRLERELATKENFHREAMSELARQLVEVIHYFSERSKYVTKRSDEARRRKLRERQQAEAREKEHDREQRKLQLLHQREEAVRLRDELLRQAAEVDGGDANSSDVLYRDTQRQCEALSHSLGYNGFDELLLVSLGQLPDPLTEGPRRPSANEQLDANGYDLVAEPVVTFPTWLTLEKERELHEALLSSLGAQFVWKKKKSLGADHGSDVAPTPDPHASVRDILKHCIDFFLPDPLPVEVPRAATATSADRPASGRPTPTNWMSSGLRVE
jgi:chromosome segregation ATPase